VLLALIATLALGGMVAACRDSDDSSGSSQQAASSSGSSSASSKCGTIPTKAPQDAEGILSSLGDKYAAAYNGWPNAIQKSPWADFKPKGGKLTVGISIEKVVNPFQAEFLKAITADLKASPSVGNIVVKTGDDAIPTQIKQYQSIVDGGADLVIIQPRAPQPFVAPIDAAAKKGVPTISVINPVPTTNAVNVGPNNWLQGATAAAAMAKLTGGKGNYAYVHGIPATAGDQNSFAGAKAALAECPNIKLAGEINGQYAPPVVKAETLKFLSTHPAKLDGVLQTATMAPSIIQAFQQVGRDVPPVADVAAQKGSLGYWNQNKSGYDSTASISGASGMAQAVADVANGILGGRGLKISDVVLADPVVTKDNIGDWAESSWNLNTQGTVDGDGKYYVADGYIDALFNK
jgi:ribose transport system substrate-binding protein